MKRLENLGLQPWDGSVKFLQHKNSEAVETGIFCPENPCEKSLELMQSSWSSSAGGGPPKTPFSQFHPVPAHPIILALSTCVAQPGLEVLVRGKIKPTGCRAPFAQGAGASWPHQLSQNMMSGLMPHVTASLAPGFVQQHPWEEKRAAMPSYIIPG